MQIVQNFLIWFIDHLWLTRWLNTWLHWLIMVISWLFVIEANLVWNVSPLHWFVSNQLLWMDNNLEGRSQNCVESNVWSSCPITMWNWPDILQILVEQCLLFPALICVGSIGLSVLWHPGFICKYCCNYFQPRLYMYTVSIKLASKYI